MEDPVQKIQDAFEELKNRGDFTPEELERMREIMARFGIAPKKK